MIAAKGFRGEVWAAWPIVGAAGFTGDRSCTGWMKEGMSRLPKLNLYSYMKKGDDDRDYVTL